MALVFYLSIAGQRDSAEPPPPLGQSSMGSRVPVSHYQLRPLNSFIESSLHDLNTVAGRRGEIEGISDVDRDAVTEDSLDNDDESNSVGCIHESYRNSMPLHDGGVDEEPVAIENSDRSLGPPYSMLFIDDILPIEAARARFLQIIVDNFINEHVIEVEDSPDVNYGDGHDKLNKRKPRDVQYEGDPRFVLPLMYVANLYETLVRDVNVRFSSLDGIREKTIGVALEAAGGLYRRLAKKFPRKGPCSFKRRELATSLETRTRFPELVVQKEKRVRFVVVNGLVIIEKPSNMNMEDAECHRISSNHHQNIISNSSLSNLSFMLSTKHTFTAKPTCYPLSANTSMHTSFSFTRYSSPASVTNYATAYGLHAIPFWRPCWRALAFTARNPCKDL